MRGGGGGQGSSAHAAAGAREATTPWGMPRDRGEVEGKAQAPVGESTWLDVRMKWLRKTADFDLELEAAHRARVLSQREEENLKNSRSLSFEIIERHLGTSQPFPKPVPLPMLVAVVNEIWDEDGL
eukprot:Tamp_38058.p1 GENE.Tamp_38058~~Tamp_38058.p1  ORF type:complete len:137 (+),score=31.63 Tamp_38058:36-413(+)